LSSESETGGRRRRVPAWLRTLLGWAAAFLIAALGAAWYTQSPLLNRNVQRLHAGAKPGQPLVDALLTDFDGHSLHLSELRGRLVLLDFWASWCPSCRASLPAIAELQRDYADDLTVLAVNVFEDAEQGAAFAAGSDSGLRFVRSPQLAERLGIRVLPSSVLLDRQGRIAWAGAGYVPLASGSLLAMRIEALQNEPP
jgi:thiol-disulfide isomerase/thioredoxin